MTSHLYLYEQVQLLSMRDEDGKPHNINLSQRLGYALAGAVIMDLLLGGLITLDKQKLVIVRHRTDSQNTPSQDSQPSPADTLLNAALQRISKAKKPKDAKYWVQIMYAYYTSSARMLDSLIAKGVIRLELRKKWKFFTVKRYPIENSAAKQVIISRLENALVRVNAGADMLESQALESQALESQTLEYETFLMLSFVKSAKLSPYVFPKRFAHNPSALENDIQEALKKQPHANFADEAMEDAERRQEMLEAIEASLDMINLAVNIVADAVDSSADAGASDGGGDGGGGGD